MSDLDREELATLSKYIDFAAGQFDLATVRGDTSTSRGLFEEWLQAQTKVSVLDLSALSSSPLDWIMEQGQLGDVLLVTGLGGQAYGPFLRSLNIQRDALMEAAPVPWVLFGSQAELFDLEQVAPDFCDMVSVHVTVAASDDAMTLLRVREYAWQPHTAHSGAYPSAVVGDREVRRARSEHLDVDRRPSTPKRIALLIGAPSPDLQGVSNDIKLMSEALGYHGFAVEVDYPATRASMIDGLQKLIAQTESGDTVALYYSGHGAQIESVTASQPLGESSYYRFLVPSDFSESTETDFRGYTGAELSLALAKLTSRTRNVTVILDCSFAGRILRDSGHARSDSEDVIEWQDTSRMQPIRHHTVRGPWLQSAAKHFATLPMNVGPLDRSAEANPYLVQVLASGASGNAYETLVQGQIVGAMTLALHDLLMSIDPTQTTWQDLGRMMRMHPRSGGRGQHIAIEGPYRRFLFSLDERQSLGEVDVDVCDERILLCGGRLAGVFVGDTYEIVTQKMAIGRATVTDVSSSHAMLDTTIHAADLPLGSRARPLQYTQARAVVELVGFEPGSMARELAEARLGSSGFIEISEHRHDANGPPIIAQLHLEEARLQLRSGALAFDRPRRYDPSTAPAGARQLIDHMAQALHLLARSSSMHHMCEYAAGDLSDDWSLSWCRVVQDDVLGPPLAAQGEHLREGDRITVQLRTTQPVYLSLFMLHADARIALLSRAQGGGVEVDEAGYVLGQRSLGTIYGVELRRPPRSVLHTQEPLPTTIVAVISDEAVDLRSWEQPGVRRFVPNDPLAPSLGEVARFPASRPRHDGPRWSPQAQTSGIKLVPPSIRPARYRIVRFDFALGVANPNQA